MKTLTKLLLGIGLTISGILGTSYLANSQYSDELYWKYHNKLPSNSSNTSTQDNCYQTRKEKRETREKIRKAFRTNDWVENHTHEIQYGNLNQDANPFTFRTDQICGEEYIWDAQGNQTYLARRTDVDLNLPATENAKAIYRKKYQVKTLKDNLGRTIVQARAKNIQLNPNQCSGFYNEDDFARNFPTKTIDGKTYIPVCISEEEIINITKNSQEQVLPLLLIPLDPFINQTILGQDVSILLGNTNGIMYATTNFDKTPDLTPRIVQPTTQITPPNPSQNQKSQEKYIADSILKSRNNTGVLQSLDKMKKQDTINYWVIRKNDTYYNIAKQTNTPLDSLIKWNNLTSKAHKGDTLKTCPYLPRNNLKK